MEALPVTDDGGKKNLLLSTYRIIIHLVDVHTKNTCGQ